MFCFAVEIGCRCSPIRQKLDLSVFSRFVYQRAYGIPRGDIRLPAPMRRTIARPLSPAPVQIITSLLISYVEALMRMPDGSAALADFSCQQRGEQAPSPFSPSLR